jgi:outer membrane protein assembly factor BamB
VAPRGNPPVRWSETANVRWKTAIPGKGQSTPIVWGDRVYVTSAVPFGEAGDSHEGHDHDDGAHDNVDPLYRMRFVVFALDRADGRIVWKATVQEERPHEPTHQTGSWASNSAATDGEHIFASFGSRGIYCLNLEGEVVWEKDLGDMKVRHAHGEGSSPVLWGDTLVVPWDHQGDSYLFALDKRTGKERWKVARDEITSWSSPIVVEHEGNPQVVVSATKRVRGYALADGKLLWEAAGLSRNVVASPVSADGYVYAANSYDTRSMMAIGLSAAKGDITGTDAVAWTRSRDTPYVPSPLLYGDMLFFLKHNHGFLTNVEAKTGKTLFGPVRLNVVGNIFASPVGAADRVYIVDRGGNGAVVRRGRAFELLAHNRLDDSFAASPAVAGDELFLRGERHLYCIAESEAKPASPPTP